MEEKTVILYDQNGHSQEFSEKHAERLLKYPGTQWSKKDEPKTSAKEVAKTTPEAK